MTTEWLTHPVPLWAFLIAVLTRPTEWTKQANRMLKQQFGPSKEDTK